MDLLEKIVAQKRTEVEARKGLYTVKLLEKSLYFSAKPVSLRKYVTRADKSGIIAEIKRQSPSKGVLNSNVSIEQTSVGYLRAGASALSILTDSTFFGGSNDDLTAARKLNSCPILRKDFVLDEYQIIEAKSIGADAVLLIAAILSPREINSLAALAHSLELEVLLEVHNREEVDENLDATVDLIGVNNRNLKTFEVDLNISKELAEKINPSVVKISESGIDSPAQVIELQSYGYQGFLMGEKFMRDSRPEVQAEEFIRELRLAQKNNADD